MDIDHEVRLRLKTTPPNVPVFRPNLGDVLGRVRVRRIRRYAGAAAVAVLLLGGVGVPLAMLSGLGGSSRQPISPPPLAVRAVFGATIRVTEGAVDVAVGEGAVWVSGFGSLTRFDPGTDRVVAIVQTPGTEDYSQVAVGLGAVWVTADGGILYRIDPVTNSVAATIRVGGPIQGVETGGAYVWVTRPTDEVGELIRVDPATNHVTGRPIEVGPGPIAAVYAFGALWVTNTSPPSVVRVDPSTGEVTTTSFTGRLAAGYGSLWSASDDSLIRVDPESGETTATIRVPRAWAVAAGEGQVWVLALPESSSPTLFYPIEGTAALWEIDPSTNGIIGEPVQLDALQPLALALGSQAAWVADYDGGTVTRFDLVPCEGSSCD
jgi:streptogramin lyase